MSVERSPLSRQNFAKLLTAPGVFAGGFLPFERAEWRGDRYSLGKAAGKTPKDLFDGVRLQVADPRNIDRSRERAVQHDLSSVVKSLERLRSHPELAGVVLSPEMIVGRDPAKVSRVRFGLANPANGAFTNEAAAAAECHAIIRRAIRSAGLSVASSSPCDTAAGFKGLQAWTDGIRLRPSRTAAALWWARTAAAVATVGFVLWMIPPVARGIQGAFASAWNSCVAAYDHLFPKLDQPWSVDASDGEFTDRVQVTWRAVPKATGYALYRDDMRVPLETVKGGDTTSFDDVSAEVGAEAKYAVRATTMFTHGQLSDANPGYRNIEPPTGVVARFATPSRSTGSRLTGPSNISCVAMGAPRGAIRRPPPAMSGGTHRHRWALNAVIRSARSAVSRRASRANPWPSDTAPLACRRDSPPATARAP